MKLTKLISEIQRISGGIVLFDNNQGWTIDDYLSDVAVVIGSKYTNTQPQHRQYFGISDSLETLDFEITLSDDGTGVSLYIGDPTSSYGPDGEDWEYFEKKCKELEYILTSHEIKFITYVSNDAGINDTFTVPFSEFKDQGSIDVLKKRGLL